MLSEKAGRKFRSFEVLIVRSRRLGFRKEATLKNEKTNTNKLFNFKNVVSFTLGAIVTFTLAMTVAMTLEMDFSKTNNIDNKQDITINNNYGDTFNFRDDTYESMGISDLKISSDGASSYDIFAKNISTGDTVKVRYASQPISVSTLGHELPMNLGE